MSVGDVINGYTVLQPFSTAGGGQCMWTFARKDGIDYFLKQFLAPTYPTLDSPGSATTKQRKLRQCEAFEAHHRRLTEALKPLVGDGGNLVATKAFFRFGAKYYKVTEKIDTASVDIEHIASSPIEQRVLILKTVAHSLRTLHRLSIVHGDLKPPNLLIKQTPSGVFTAKLIDFDNSYIAGEPPDVREDLVGDVVYYSPEMARYVNNLPGSDARDLTTKSDIFALGVVYAQYLSGGLPLSKSGSYRYPWLAVEEGAILEVRMPGVPRHLTSLVGAMLAREPANRPTIEEVYGALKVQAPPIPVPKKEPKSSSGVLKGSLLRRLSEREVSPETENSSSPLKGSLIRKRKD